MYQSFVTIVPPKPLSRVGIAWQICCDFTFTFSIMWRKCRCLIDIDNDGSAV